MESISIEIINGSKSKVLISSIYRASNTNVNLFNEQIERHLSQIGKKNGIICGDFNIDLLKTDLHPDTNIFMELLYSHGMFPLINKPTRVTSNTATLIDNIFINDLKLKIQSGTSMSVKLTKSPAVCQ